MDLTLHFEAWHIITASLAIAFHAGAMWYKVSQIQTSLANIAKEARSMGERVRQLELNK